MMKHKWAAAALALLIVATVSAGVHASSGRNTIRFGGPVALPGIVLPAGEYRFEILGNSADVVRVSAASDNRPFYMGVTTRVARPRGNGNRVIELGEAPAGSAQPIRVWYPSDGEAGHEFIY
jgi:hypothetical protein